MRVITDEKKFIELSNSIRWLKQHRTYHINKVIFNAFANQKDIEKNVKEIDEEIKSKEMQMDQLVITIKRVA